MTRTLVAITLLAAFAASRVSAQQAEPRLRLRALRFPGDTLEFTLPPSAVGAGLLVWPRPDPATLARRWADSLRARLALREEARWHVAISGADSAALFGLGTTAPSGGIAPPPFQPAAASKPTLLQRYANLGMLLHATFELRWDRLKNLRCQPSDIGVLGSGCNSAVAPPRLDPQFDVRTGGVIGQRVHLDVNYNSQNEFEASNNVRVYYQGLEDEVLQRVEVGNVTFNAPNSRFITGGIPANNFGFQATAQFGPLSIGGIFAQQKGNVVQGRTYVVGQQTVQPVDRQLTDRDYERDRFFFVVDPATIPGYPAVDILNLSQAGLPLADQVVQVRVYRRRSTVGVTTAQQNYGGIPAVATRPDSPQRAGPFSWDLLIEGRDYYLDPSGLWFALTNQLDAGDYLAVSYITAAGDTVGTFPAAAQPGRVDTLRLIHEPQSGPDVPTFRYSMRNVYRVGGISGVLRDSVQLQILVSQSARPTAGAATFLALLGLALPTDQTQFDEVDRLFPRPQDPSGGAPLRDYFVVFPTLQPFADSSRLPPQFRNDSLYQTPGYLLFTEGPTPLYELALHYQATGGDTRGSLSLGAVQIRPGTERVTVGGQTLTRNVDYTINYDIGQITFLNPDSLFPQPRSVTVQYEEQPGFAVAPTSIYGLQGTYDLGAHGSVSMLGLLQQQKSNFTRPPLGFEPQSNFVGGISGNFNFQPMGLTRLLNRLPGVHTTAPSTVTLQAELATSRPSPNQAGQAWVETFEGSGGMFLPLTENSWQLGSRPASAYGLGGTGISTVSGFQDANAVPLVWQNLIHGTGGAVRYTSQDIDPEIVTQGASQTLENVLWLYMYPDSVGGLPDANGNIRWYLPSTSGPRWRSITLPLSPTGVDLSRVEYLEFWVFEDPTHRADSEHTSIIFDFGRVYEDAVSFVPTSFRVTANGDTVYTGRRRIGEGRLQTERDTLTNAWNALDNDTGIWGAVADSIFNASSGQMVYNMPLCTSPNSLTLTYYQWGDQRARCTRHDGVPETEDLNGDGHLDTLVAAVNESYFRYVFHMGDSRYFVRNGGPADTSGGRWRLYRIPFRADTLQVGAPDIRQIRSLRITVVAPASAGPERADYFGLARLQLVGAPWVKRAPTPIAGIAGSEGTAHGEVIASIVSTENTDLGYTPPPGVTNQGQTNGGNYAAGATQINEQSLRLIGRDIGVGERAEAYYQFPEGPRNFLGYRQLHVWARGRGPGWDDDQLSFYIKVGQDENNFYMYRTHVHTATWTPDVAVDLARWQQLRAQIEIRYLEGQPPSGSATCGGDSLAYVACDSSRTYIVHVLDPGVAPPNLAQVRELAVGFERDSGAVSDSVELWVDDIRLSQAVKTAGYAGAVGVHVIAADVADVNVLATRQDGNFRQLGQDPSYVTQNQFSLGGTVHLDRLGLDRLGVAAPLTIQVNRSSSDPYFLSGTDVLAAPLTGLRRPQSSQTAFSLGLRRTRQGTRWWQRWLVDRLSVAGAVSTNNTTSQLSQSSGSVASAQVNYSAQPADHEFRYVPGFLVHLLRAIPLLGRADFVRGLGQARLRWTPVTVRLSSGISSAQTDLQTFRVPIATQSDTLATTVHSTQASLRNAVGVELRPLTSTSLTVNYTSTRDLKNYGDSTSIGVLTREASQRFAGIGVGFESARGLTSRLAYNPQLFSWLRPRVSVTTNFSLTRNPNGGLPERTIGDTAGAYRLPTTFTNGRTTDIGGTVDFSRALRSLLGDSSRLLPWLDHLLPLDFHTHSDLRSQFYRAGVDPSLGYQLGLGGVSAFRQVDGRPAVSAGLSQQTQLSSGLRLPFGFGFNASYSRGLQQSWSVRGVSQAETDQTNTTWPDVTGRWTWTPRRGILQKVITSLNASAGLRVVKAVTTQPPLALSLGGENTVTTGGVSNIQSSRSWPLSLAVTWGGRINTSMSYNVSRSLTNQAGSVTHNSENSASASLSFAFRPPQEIVPLKSDVRTSLRFSSDDTRGCLTLVGSSDCLPTFDSGRQEYDFSMDTDMPPNISAGFALGYILTSDAVNDRKFAHLVLTISVSVNFQAGQQQ